MDLRTGAFDVPPQEILTRDSVTVSVDAVVYYQVSNPLAAICNNDDYNRSTRLLAATTLRYLKKLIRSRLSKYLTWVLLVCVC